MALETQIKQSNKKEIWMTLLPFALILLVLVFCIVFIDSDAEGYLPIIEMILILVIVVVFLAILKDFQIRKANRILSRFALNNDLKIVHRTKNFLFSQGEGDKILGTYKDYNIEVGLYTSILGLVGLKITEVRIKNKSRGMILIYNDSGSKWSTQQQIEKIPVELRGSSLDKSPTNKILFDDPDFIKKYTVYSDDEKYARQIIDAEMLNQLNRKKIQLLINPDEIYYSKNELPHNFKEFQSEIDFVIDLAKRVNK